MMAHLLDIAIEMNEKGSVIRYLGIDIQADLLESGYFRMTLMFPVQAVASDQK
ncbi:hypothetical protein ACFL6N_00285 [Thermodesulfobacteriota bacterium]